MKSIPPALYLIPTPLGEGAPVKTLSAEVGEAIRNIECFAVERVRTACRYIRKIAPEKALEKLAFFPLEKHGERSQLEELLTLITQGKALGLMCDAGLPAIADPGAKLVAAAHEKKIDVIPLAGPSSIFLSLMACGMNGQRFTFNGYLPIQQKERMHMLKTLESRSEREDVTEVFIETPFRNLSLFEAIIKACKRDTYLCVASDISLPTAQIKTLRVAQWRHERPALHKHPSVFCLYARPLH